MTTKWRPEGWEEHKMDGCKIYYEYEPFEAGADAMLEALRKTSENLNGSIDVSPNATIVNNECHFQGTVVFIPDDEEKQ